MGPMERRVRGGANGKEGEGRANQSLVTVV